MVMLQLLMNINSLHMGIKKAVVNINIYEYKYMPGEWVNVSVTKTQLPYQGLFCNGSNSHFKLRIGGHLLYFGSHFAECSWIFSPIYLINLGCLAFLDS